MYLDRQTPPKNRKQSRFYRMGVVNHVSGLKRKGCPGTLKTLRLRRDYQRVVNCVEKMAEPEIQCLKDNIDKLVEIETTNGECLVAKVLFVIHDEEYDEHELLYEVVSSNMLESYLHRENAGGYALDFHNTVLVRPFSDSDANQLGARS